LPNDDAPPIPRRRAHTGAAACALALLAACGTPGPVPLITRPDTHQEADAMRVSTLDAQRVDRVSFGVDALALQQVGRLGYARWVDEQLHPKPFALPASVDARNAQMKITRVPLVLNEYRAVFGGLFQRLYGLDAQQLQRVFPGGSPRDLKLV